MKNQMIRLQKVELSMKKKIIAYYTMEYLLIIYFILFILKSTSLITTGDGFNQYYPVMVYTGKYIRKIVSNLIQGQFIIPQFDFSIGLGEGVLPSLNYYGFGDPFLIISALFPVEYSAYGYTVIIFLKIYVSGLTFLLYCVNRKCSGTNILVGLPFYICNQYTLCHGSMYPITFLTAMVTLPLICMGIDRVLENKKQCSLILVLSVAFSALSGFYVLYMELIFAGIYALIHIVCKEKRVKEILLYVFSLFSQVLLGLCLAGGVIIPAIIGYFSSGRNGSQSILSIWHMLFADKGTLWKGVSSIIIPSGFTEVGLMIPVFACSLICIALVKAKCIKPLKILFIIFLCAYLNMKVASYIAGGFTSAIYYGRWIFAIIFLISVLIVKGMEYVSETRAYKYMISTIIFTVLVVCIGKAYFQSNEVWVKVGIQYVTISIIFFIIYYICDKVAKNNFKTKYAVILCSIVVGIICNINSVYNEYGGRWYLKPYKDVRNEILASNAELYQTDGSFGRMDIQGNIRNESLYIGHYSANEYLSMINSNIVDFYKEYALVAEMYGSVHHLIGLGGRDTLDDLLSIQYTNKPIMKYGGQAESNIVKNDDCLPLGITFDSCISNQSAAELNAVEKTAAALETVILDEDIKNDDIIGVSDSIKSALADLEYKIDYKNVEFLEQGQIQVTENSVINISFKSDVEGDCYLYSDKWKMTNNDTGTGHVYFNDIYCEFKGVHSMYTHGVECVSINLGKVEKENVNNCKITFSENAIYDIDNLHIYVLDSNYVKQTNAKRRTEVFQNVKIDGNKICGDIVTDNDKFLFLSVPYSKGWRAIVNGEETEIIRADYGFSAIRLEKGKNEVLLEYTTPGLILGLVISILSIISLFGWIYMQGRNEK